MALHHSSGLDHRELNLHEQIHSDRHLSVELGSYMHKFGRPYPTGRKGEVDDVYERQVKYRREDLLQGQTIFSKGPAKQYKA